MFSGPNDGGDYLSRSMDITTQYEIDRALRRPQRWRPSGASGFVIGMAAGIFLGSKARKEADGPDSGRAPYCF